VPFHADTDSAAIAVGKFRAWDYERLITYRSIPSRHSAALRSFFTRARGLSRRLDEPACDEDRFERRKLGRERDLLDTILSPIAPARSFVPLIVLSYREPSPTLLAISDARASRCCVT